MICSILDPITARTIRDLRNVARKAVNYLKSTGIGDTGYMGPEIGSSSSTTSASTRPPTPAIDHIDSVEGQWIAAAQEKPNLGEKSATRRRYFPCRRPTRR